MEQENRNNLEKLFNESGFTDFKWMRAKDVVVAHWVRMKCMFGCEDYGGAACPPNVGSIKESKKFINEYSDMVVFHFNVETTKDNYASDWAAEMYKKLLKLERAVFLQNYYKAFILNMCTCNICSSCSSERSRCKTPRLGRPTPEALGVDCFATVRKIGFPINVLTNDDKSMARYAFLLVE